VGQFCHPPDEPPRVGVRVIDELAGNGAAQVPGQLIPAGELVTVPLPFTSKVRVTDGVLPPGHAGSLGSFTVTVALPTTIFSLEPVSLLLVAVTVATPQPAPVGDTTPPATVSNCGESVVRVTSPVISRIAGG
jgi:hypothetical protein